MDNPVLHFLPEGWTDERYRNATDRDYQSLTKEDLQKVMERSAAESRVETRRWVDEKNEKRRALGKELLKYEDFDCDESQMAGSSATATATATIPDPAQQNLEMLVIQAEEDGWKNFGFWAVRVHYSDQPLWENFMKDFFELLDEGIAAAPAESGLSRLNDNILIQFLDDDDFANQGPQGVSYAYQLCIQDGEPFEVVGGAADGQDYPAEPELGMMTSMCLMVDEECMRSVVERKSGSTPFVKAVDVSLHQCHQDGVTLPYSGSFKVAVTSLIAKFYAALLQNTPAEVAETVPDDGIWRDIGPFDSERESRKIDRLIGPQE